MVRRSHSKETLRTEPTKKIIEGILILKKPVQRKLEYQALANAHKISRDIRHFDQEHLSKLPSSDQQRRFDEP